MDIDRARMAKLGLTLPDVSASLQAVFGSVQAGNLQAFGREWPILLKIDPAGRGEVERLIRTNLRTARGELISLSEVAAVHLENQPAYLERVNISPAIAITAGLDGDLSLAEARFLCERLVTESLPELDERESRALAPADAACKGPGPVRRRPRPGWWPVACFRPHPRGGSWHQGSKGVGNQFILLGPDRGPSRIGWPVSRRTNGRPAAPSGPGSMRS